MPEWIAKYWVQWVFGIISAGICAYVRGLSKQIKKEREEQQAMRDGMRALLRRQIIYDCEKAVQDGFCSADGKDTITGMYQSYHALGGNSVVTELYDSMIHLPTTKGG